MHHWIVVYLLCTFLCLTFCGTAHVYVDEEGGYRNVKFAVNSDVKIKDCEEFRQKIQIVIESFSKSLWVGTQKKLRVASADVVLPRNLADKCQISDMGQHHTWNSADVRIGREWHIQQQWGPVGAKGVGVHQPMGCGKEGDYISLQSTLLDRISHGEEDQNGTSENLTEGDDPLLRNIGDSLLSAWARYRWGLFEERQYEGDPNYPPDLLPPNAKLDESSAPSNTSRSNETVDDASIMKRLSSYPKASTFCEPSSHDGLSLNPQNLICKGRSAREVMNQHSDFFTESQSNVWWREKSHLQNAITEASLSDNLQNPDTLEQYFTDYFSANEPSDLPDAKAPSPETASYSSPLKLDPYASKEAGQDGNGRRKRGANFVSKENFLEEEVLSTTAPAEILGQKGENQSEDLDQSFNSEDGSVSWVSSKPPYLPLPSSEVNHSVTWVRNEKNSPRPSDPLHVDSSLKSAIPQIEEIPHADVRFLSAPPKVVVVALDLSSPSVAQASVEWLRGGLFRWLFGIGQAVNVGILASYSNTSFPLSLGPLSPGPVSAHQLEEHLALLPYQHEIDSNVYGGLYCLSCIMEEAAKMLQSSGVPLSSGILILVACKPELPPSEMSAASQIPIEIHTVAICPNAPLSLEYLAVPEGSWALSPARMGKGSAAETQLSRILTEITKEAVLWPGDPKLHVILEEEKMLGQDDVERVGPYRRVKGSIAIQKNSTPRLVIMTTSSPAKVAELNVKGKRIPFNRDTPQRFWALLDEGHANIYYSLKFLSTSLELPLTVTTGVYDRIEKEGIRVRLRTSTRKYHPNSSENPYLIVWAEVTKGGHSVVNADVSLSLTYLSGLIPSTYSLRLLDDGSTEPDIRADDGMYSRYLTWIPGKGRYVLTATASSTSASTIKYFTEEGQVISERTGHFTSASTSLSVLVEEAPRGDIFPPSRITDLNAEPLGNGLINITWTAPGGDLDQGSAWKYKLKMYTDFVALKTKFDSSGIDVFCIQGDERTPTPVPSLFGTPQHCVASLPFSNLRWFFALRSIDGANNTGSISNIVSVFIQDPGTTVSSKRTGDKNSSVQTVLMSTIIPTVKVEDLPSSPSGDGSWQMYGVAIVSAIIFVMVAIVIFACIICCRKARARSSKEQDRPIYKIYVNNAYIQEDDGEIKVVGKNPTLDDKEHTQQWVNSLEKFGHTDTTRGEEQVENLDTSQDPNNSGSNKFVKPVRFGVLTNGSIMREPPSSSSSSSSKPSEEATNEDFKYKDLSETISNSTAEEGATASTSSGGATDGGPTIEPQQFREHRTSAFAPPVVSQLPAVQYEIAYPPLGIPPIPVNTIMPVNSGYGRPNEYSSDEEGGFRPRSMAEPKFQRHLTPQFSSFRYVPSHQLGDQFVRRPFDYPPSYDSVSRATGAPLQHGTVRSVKKRRHISFV